jgi:hypothetical protein
VAHQGLVDRFTAVLVRQGQVVGTELISDLQEPPEALALMEQAELQALQARRILVLDLAVLAVHRAHQL